MKKLFLLLAIITLQSCNSNGDCDDTIDNVFVCNNSFDFNFRLLDKDTKENLILNNTFEENDIKFIDINNPSNVLESYYMSSGTFSVYEFFQESKTIRYKIELSSENILEISANADLKEIGGCCKTKVEITNLIIEGNVFELDSDNIYNIFI
ncbi:hypothetical protein [Tenacibaculum jejuense]|uniref:Lipoprotein n=1 Tax=Tenacibaculum jejuense TaxID=584609 RepID=A0A238U7Q3_9FLAO|nr:hypothetical protein [Tenacibaculum jejuense]SNR14524.1 protein of unknown function [Tenacibaculum jejuense]